jgi:extradiol dioxygenase family protein
MMSIVDHIAILVDDLEVAEEWYTQKLAGKVTFRDSKYIRMPLEMGEVVYHRDGTTGVYVKDPFGNYLEYIWYSDEQKEIFLDD